MSRASSKSSKAQAPKVTRRSSSVFTSVSDALVMRDQRPSRYEAVEYEDGIFFDVYKRTPKGGWTYVASCASESSARRLRSKIDAEAAFRPTQKQIEAARKARDKAKA